MNRKTLPEEADEPMNVVPAGIRELLEQRGTYREWLERLDEVGGQYRSDVAERVRADYQARLEAVAGELEGHRHEIVSTLDRRRGRLDELSGAFDQRSAELEEAELRFQVGEFDDETWDGKRAELTEGLQEIETELNDERGAVEELERVLGELSSGESAAAAAPPAEEGVDEQPAPEPAAADEPAAGGEAADEPAAADELAALEAMEASHESPGSGARGGAGEPYESAESTDDDDHEPEETESARSRPAATAEAEETAAGSDDRADDYLDELEFLESLSLDDPDSFDAVSRMLEDEEDR